jgi:hypothetical protein
MRRPLPVSVLSVRQREVVASIRSCVAFLGLLAFIAAGAWAQTAESGEISGTVTDPAGAVVPGATVLVHNTDTSADRSLTTNQAGIHPATFLQTGHYEVSVAKEGFSKAQHTAILLEVGRSISIDFALTVQAGTQTVTVSSETPVVDTEKTEAAQEVTQTWSRICRSSAAAGIISYCRRRALRQMAA